jgi:G3E family GTPase
VAQEKQQLTNGWVFESEANTPATLNNFVNRTVKPILRKKGIVWKNGGLYAAVVAHAPKPST